MQNVNCSYVTFVNWAGDSDRKTPRQTVESMIGSPRMPAGKPISRSKRSKYPKPELRTVLAKIKVRRRNGALSGSGEQQESPAITNKIGVAIPRVLQTDIRRSYFHFLASMRNSSDLSLAGDFHQTFMVPEIRLIINDSIFQQCTIVVGQIDVNKFLKYRASMVPDGVWIVQPAHLIAKRGGASILTCDFESRGTFVFSREILDEQMRLQSQKQQAMQPLLMGNNGRGNVNIHSIELHCFCGNNTNNNINNNTEDDDEHCQINNKANEITDCVGDPDADSESIALGELEEELRISHIANRLSNKKFIADDQSSEHRHWQSQAELAQESIENENIENGTEKETQACREGGSDAGRQGGDGGREECGFSVYGDHCTDSEVESSVSMELSNPYCFEPVAVGGVAKAEGLEQMSVTKMTTTIAAAADESMERHSKNSNSSVDEIKSGTNNNDNNREKAKEEMKEATKGKKKKYKNKMQHCKNGCDDQMFRIKPLPSVGMGDSNEWRTVSSNNYTSGVVSVVPFKAKGTMRMVIGEDRRIEVFEVNR